MTSPAAGHLFEIWSHDVISRGGNFVLQRMRDDGNHLRTDGSTAAALAMGLSAIPLTQYDLQEQVSTTSAPDKYYIPSATNNPTFDSFFVTGGVGVGLQMTLAATHSLKPMGLKDLKVRLGAVTTRRFVFVIPKNRTFTCTKPSSPELAHFEFFTLTMNLSDGGLPAILIFMF
jgi:hypothetical protein